MAFPGKAIELSEPVLESIEPGQLVACDPLRMSGNARPGDAAPTKGRPPAPGRDRLRSRVAERVPQIQDDFVRQIQD